MEALDRLSRRVNQALAWLAGLAMVAMMLFTVLDMAMRALGGQIAGSYEVIGWLMAASVALALGYTQVNRGHVAIDLFTTRLSSRSRAAMDLATSLLSLALFAATAWYVAHYGRVLETTGSLSETLRVVVYPWVYAVAVGALGLALALAVDVLRAAARLAGRHGAQG